MVGERGVGCERRGGEVVDTWCCCLVDWAGKMGQDMGLQGIQTYDQLAHSTRRPIA